MSDYINIKSLEKESKKSNLDWEVYNNTFYIYNFIVENKNQGIGTDVMNEIFKFCVTNDIPKIEAHIDLTYRTED